MSLSVIQLDTYQNGA